MNEKIIVYQTKNDIQLYGSIKELMAHEKPKQSGVLLSKWAIYRRVNIMRDTNAESVKFDKGILFERYIKRAKR